MSSSNLQGWSSNQPGRHSQKPLGADQTAERNSTLASTWWQKKSTRVHTDPVGSLKSNFSPTFTCGGKKKDERGRISKEARKLAGQVYTKYKADSLAFVRKEIQATKNAMDRALTVARSFSTKERRKLSIGLSAAKEAEAAKNKEVLGGNQLSEPPTPLHTKRWKRRQQERKKHGGRLPQILMGPHTNFYLFIF